jgi:hypothetical protein
MSAIIFEGFLSEFFDGWILVFCDSAVHCWVIGSPHSFVMSGASHSNAELHGIRLESSIISLFRSLMNGSFMTSSYCVLYFTLVYMN